MKRTDVGRCIYCKSAHGFLVAGRILTTSREGEKTRERRCFDNQKVGGTSGIHRSPCTAQWTLVISPYIVAFPRMCACVCGDQVSKNDIHGPSCTWHDYCLILSIIIIS